MAYKRGSVVEDKPAVRCLLCSEEMKLEVYETTSYWQCQQDPTHRLSLTEWSNLRDGDRAKEQAMVAMKERQVILQKQL